MNSEFDHRTATFKVQHEENIKSRQHYVKINLEERDIPRLHVDPP